MSTIKRHMKNRGVLWGAGAVSVLALAAALTLVPSEAGAAAEPPLTDQERAQASWAWLIDGVRMQEFTTSQHLEILADNWVSDEELADIEQGYRDCIADNFPGATVEFSSHNFSRTIFVDAEQEAMSLEGNPCAGFLGLIRPLHHNMRELPDHPTREQMIQECWQRDEFELGASLTEDEIANAIYDSDFLANHPESMRCVIGYTEFR